MPNTERSDLLCKILLDFTNNIKKLADDIAIIQRLWVLITTKDNGSMCPVEELDRGTKPAEVSEPI
jgi:hypothetical protein